MKPKRLITEAIFLAFFLGVSSGCSHVISSEMRAAAREDLDFTMVLADPERYHGELVIWGGCDPGDPQQA